MQGKYLGAKEEMQASSWQCVLERGPPPPIPSLALEARILIVRCSLTCRLSLLNKEALILSSSLFVGKGLGLCKATILSHKSILSSRSPLLEAHLRECQGPGQQKSHGSSYPVGKSGMKGSTVCFEKPFSLYMCIKRMNKKEVYTCLGKSVR